MCVRAICACVCVHLCDGLVDLLLRLFVQWTPEGRRLVTGASSGEFTLWNGLTFNFETILQVNAHPSNFNLMTADELFTAYLADGLKGFPWDVSSTAVCR